MSVQETSRHAYHYSVLPNLGERQRAVYEALLEHGPMTNREIKDVLGAEINAITPRTNELVHLGLVRECGRKETEGGRSAILWEAGRNTLF